MTSQIENIVKTYRALASIPVLVGAKLVNNNSIINSVWNQRNLERGKTTKFTRTHLLSPELQKLSDTTPLDSSGASLVSTSPSESYRALIREVDEKEGRKQYLEIWSHYNLTQTVDLSSLDLHGDVYTDVSFGVMKWSPDESKLLYIAEKKEPKKEPFYKRKSIKQEDAKEGEIIKGEQYVFKQDWGEQFVNKKQSVIIQYDLIRDTFKIIEGIPEGLCPMHPVWSPDGTYIVGVALRTQPRKLGLIYCTNRPGSIFTLDFNENYDEISPEGKSVKCPTFTPDGNTLVWLERDVGGPHHSCMTLVKRDLPLKKKKKVHIDMAEPTVIVPVVNTEKITLGGQKFYGLYNSGFIKRCWASDRRLLLSTNQKNTINTYVVDIDTGVITELEYSSGSQIVLDVHDDIVLVNRRNYCFPDKLAIGRLPPKGQEASIVFEEVVTSEKITNLEDYTYEYLNLKYEQPTKDAVDTFSAIYIGPKTGEKHQVPLIVWPHGGPHSAFANNMALESSLFGAFGFAILLINYRGSIGSGQATIDFLLGKIGDSDVADCIFATKEALNQFPWLDPNRMALVGGSHGGFLVTHISGQHPDMFKAVVARNPVIDVASMSIISDIPDWSYVECGMSYAQAGPLNDEQLLAMRKASPIEHAHKVKAPTLLQIGSKDLRVPPAQATEYYHRLKANGITVKMNLYDDNHPLGNVTNEMDNLINSLLWIEQYVNIHLGIS